MDKQAVAAFKSAFDSSDKDHDGKINLKEFEATIKSLHLEDDDLEENELQNALKKYGSGTTIDFAGFNKYVSAKLKDLCDDDDEDPLDDPLADEGNKYLSTVFDKKGKGLMSLEQFQKALALQGQSLTVQKAKDLLKKHDGDKDGFLNYDEYMQVLMSEF